MLLNGEWQCEIYRDGALYCTLAATVPGCVHTDLYHAGLIDDYFYRDNNRQLQWIETCDVTYTKKFRADTAAGGEYLLFAGLDCYCDIYLNGIKIGAAEDMFTAHRFPCGDAMRCGENVLAVKFRSPVNEVRDLPVCEGAFSRERMHTRRIQCTYGWDWVARFVTMGICGEVSLERETADSLDSVYVYTSDMNAYAASVVIEAAFNRVTGSAAALFEIEDAAGAVVYSEYRAIFDSEIALKADIENAALWYPAGYGAQPLYTLKITVNGRVHKTVFGIRTVNIIEPVDAENSEFAARAQALRKAKHLKNCDKNEKTTAFFLLVNGERIFCQGGNYVPCSPFVSPETDARLQAVVRAAGDCGYNMLRVWGGGIFERDAFYDECDRLGILVTQDFLSACGSYPEQNPDFIEKIRAEAEYAAKKLRNHPCLVWWTGDNENATQGYFNKPEFPGRITSVKGIAPVLKKYDPQRRFLLSSPYGGVPFQSATCGTTHNTCFLGDFFDFAVSEKAADYYREINTYLSRFTAEQPTFGMPFVSSLRRFMTDADIFGENQEIAEYHCQNNPYLAQTLFAYANQMAEGFFGQYKNPADRIYKLQLLQCEWLRISFELYRRNQWFSSGIIYWMFNDCWPTSVSWSMLDYYGNPKPAYYIFRRCAKQAVASVTAENGKIRVYICVNGSHPVRACGRLYVYNVVSGEERTVAEFADRYPVGSTIGAAVEEAEIFEIAKDENILLCDITSGDNTDRAFFCPHPFRQVPFGDGAAFTVTKSGDKTVITARETVPYVMVDSTEVLSDNCFFLKKGETATVYKVR